MVIKAKRSPDDGGARDRSLPIQVLVWAAVGFAAVYALVVLVAIWSGTATGGRWWDPGSQGVGDWFELARTVATFVGVLGAAVIAFLAYRRQRTSEAQHALDRARLADERAVDLRTRFGAAADQLGGGPAVRMAGVYAMAQVADDWSKATTIEGYSEQVQQCIDVLCAYYRLPLDPDSELARSGGDEVRSTVVRVITAHLQDPGLATTWCGRDLDFSGAVFDGRASFWGATFSGGTVSFYKSRFTGGVANFTEAMFCGATVDFTRAEFIGGTLGFNRAAFVGPEGILTFDRASFRGTKITFDGAHFRGGKVLFTDPRSWSRPPSAPSLEPGEQAPPGVSPSPWPDVVPDPAAGSQDAAVRRRWWGGRG